MDCTVQTHVIQESTVYIVHWCIYIIIPGVAIFTSDKVGFRAENIREQRQLFNKNKGTVL